MTIFEPITLCSRGHEYVMTFKGRLGGPWQVLIDGELWAVARRVKQNLWAVTRSGPGYTLTQAGVTLTKAAVALFYEVVRAAELEDQESFS